MATAVVVPAVVPVPVGADDDEAVEVDAHVGGGVATVAGHVPAGATAGAGTDGRPPRQGLVGQTPAGGAFRVTF